MSCFPEQKLHSLGRRKRSFLRVTSQAGRLWSLVAVLTLEDRIMPRGEAGFSVFIQYAKGREAALLLIILTILFRLITVFLQWSLSIKTKHKRVFEKHFKICIHMAFVKM